MTGDGTTVIDRRSLLAAAGLAACSCVAPSSGLHAEGGPIRSGTGRQRTRERRTAVVIGNSGYEHLDMLKNPQHDAIAVASALRKVGFDQVDMHIDATQVAMTNALATVRQDVADPDWVLVYYAGHGLEIGGTNYLIPTDARLENVDELEKELVPLARALAPARNAAKLGLLIVDACRDNPFKEELRARVPSRSIGRSLGDPTNLITSNLGEMNAPESVIVAYATRAGDVALDGEGANSPFAAALARNIVRPAQELRAFFSALRDDVLAATNLTQQPFIYGRLAREYFIVPP